MIFFGDEWPDDEWRSRLLHAPALQCLYCDQPILPDDSGVIMPLVLGALNEQPEVSCCAYHRRCLFESLGIPLSPSSTISITAFAHRSDCSICKGPCEALEGHK